MYIKQDLNYKRREDLEVFKPSIIIECTNLEHKTLVGVSYRSPSTGEDENNKLNLMIEKISGETKQNDSCILTGDFNYPEIDWDKNTCSRNESHQAAKFLETISSQFIAQLVTNATHHRALQTANILDLVLSWKEEKVSDIIHYPPWGKSHHAVITFNITLPSPTKDEKDKTGIKFAFDKGDYNQMRESLTDTNWTLLMAQLDVENCWKLLHDKITELKNNLVPKRHTQNSSSARGRVPRELLDKIKIKRKAYNNYKRYKTKANHEAYTRARNQVKWAIRKFTKDRELEVAKNIKKDPKKFFAYVSSKMKPKDKIANLLKSDKTLTESNQEKAEVLNSFFASVFTEEEKDNIPNFPQRTSEKLLTLEISTKDMEDKLKKLNPTKSEGPDGLHPRILKELAHELSYPLKILFDKSIKENKIPTAWKQAEPIPIHLTKANSSGICNSQFSGGSFSEEGLIPTLTLERKLCTIVTSGC
ncbi:hypothetical protein ACOMHN_021024 [Nucella lapillus]